MVVDGVDHVSSDAVERSPVDREAVAVAKHLEMSEKPCHPL